MPTIDDPENILPVPPYARRWSYHISQTHTTHNAIRIIRNILDRMQENEFIWIPYLHGLPELQSLSVYAMRTPWNIRCPLIHYSIVEMHHIEWVLRQFGMIQDIPPNPLVSERHLHQIDRRGRHEEDWVVFHRDYILKWNDVHSLTVVRPEVGNGRATVPDYMNWYHHISWYNLMEIITLQAENSDPNDFTPLRDVRSRTIAYGRQMMNFSSERYTSVRIGPTSTYEAGPSNVYTEPGPSNVYTPTGPSNVYTPAGPSNVCTEVGPSNIFTPAQSFDIYAEAQRHLGISPVPLKARN
ncbi:UNVERIFIED_CONTAM: hypothetical protein Sradi_3635600 [Sesamum radiatum]|uniref:Aminotransferase-like plant mobile domain-containing protein n=1 Tax=Sesamum radiatum TaxID=300843 RepID=A0AAW2QI80_SESRA